MLIRRLLSVAFLMSAGLSLVEGQTPSITTMAHFSGTAPTTTEGNGPRGSLVFGADGQLYGTTELGGAGSGSGNGVAFKIDDSSVFTPLAEFGGTTTGSAPNGKLTLADDGNYYGTTSGGGADGVGTVFKMTPTGTLTTLYTFRELTKKDTGSVPKVHLTLGNDGFLYGTTSQGGANGYGTIYKILPGSPNTPVRLVDFTGQGGSFRGTNPSALLLAKDGNFYGTTEGGGTYSNGTVFKLTPKNVFANIVDFGQLVGVYTGPVSPRAGLIQASNGVMYGTSAGGGTDGEGTVFSVTTTGVKTVLVNFSGDGGAYPGSTPEAVLYQATDNYLYGTTRLGGTATSKRGTVFRMTVTGVFKSLIQFTGGSPVYGAEPKAGLVQDNEGHLYGTTSTGGTSNLGTVFRLDNALPIKATVSTGGVINPFGGTRATMTGTVNPQGTNALYYFEYGLTSSYGSRSPATDASAGAGKITLTKQATATGLIPSTTYHYRIRAANGGGTTWGPDQTFTTGPNPNVVANPLDQLVGIGTAADFDVTAIGVTLRYGWYKTGSTTPLSATANLHFAKTALAHAGSYYVAVSDGADLVKTPAARLGVISIANTAVTVNEGAETTLALQNAGPDLSFQWKTVSGNVVNDSRVTGATTTALRITNAGAGDTQTYYCTVKLGSLSLDSGNFVLTTRLKPVINMPSIPTWTTNGQAYGSITAQNSPTGFAATGLPQGVIINPLTGTFSGRPLASGTYTVQFKASNLAGEGRLDFPVTVAPAVIGEAGSYAGLVNRDATGNLDMGGGISFSITSAGTGTGKLVHQGNTLSFTTLLDNVPGSTRVITVTQGVGQKNFPAVTAVLTGATGDVTGTVNGVAFSAKRNAWSSLLPVPTAQSGRFNVTFAVPSAKVGDAAYPQGYGIGTMVIDTLGNVAWTGHLSDGSAISATTLLAANNVVVLHHPLYAVGTGSAQGSLTVGNDSSVTSTGFDWLKNAQVAATRSYATGFPLHSLRVQGGKYIKPVGAVNALGLNGTTSNAKVTFDQGGTSAPITQMLNFPASNAITVALPNANTVAITLDTTTGLFSGSFVIPDAVAANKRTTTFAGILLQSTQQGLGYFNLAQLPSPTTSALLSGNVTLAAP